MANDGIGIENEQLKGEFARVVRELNKFANAIDARELGKMQRSAMKLTQDAMKAEIKDASETFKVYATAVCTRKSNPEHWRNPLVSENQR